LFLLEKDGNWDMVGVNNGAALHRAAFAGDLAMVQRLVAKGADISNRKNPFNSSPLGWADHNNQAEVIQWIRTHCAIDLHDAVTFDFLDHVERRLSEDARAVHLRVDYWDIPQATALHCAALMGRDAAATLLLGKGADRNALAGNGLTPLDVAAANGAAGVVKLIEERGGRRASDAPGRAKIRAQPLYRIDEQRSTLHARALLDEKDWDAVIAALAEQRLSALDASGQMTDALIERIVALGHVTGLELGGSRGLTDAGVRHLARLPQLQRLDLSGTGVTDRGLGILRELPDLRTFRLHHEDISDAGLMHLADCHRLERVDVFPGAGAGTLRALGGKPRLHNLRAGKAFEEERLALLHDFPVFTTWQGGAIKIGLMDYDADPNSLTVHPAAPYSQRGLEPLAGLDGLFALNLDNPVAKNAGLEPLLQLPRLGWLGHDATDESMRVIGQLPHLRMLMAQDTEAGDEGFVALSRSRTLEYIWGRRCYNLTGRGFAALSTIPSLRGLSVSCRNVDDAALSTLRRFPALRELMPMDVQDAGFRHVGRCENLERLWCMYCRDTTDIATEHIAGLPKLKTYYAGQTKITDRSLEILSRMPSLEMLEFWNCGGITNAGVAHLAALPALAEISIDGCRQVTPEAIAVFPARVRAKYSV
jgi:hypothetical protein